MPASGFRFAATAAAAFGTAGLLLGFVVGLAVGANRNEPPGIAPVQPVSLAPTDFAILPCPEPAKGGSCAIIAAGGKRLLVGAPAGIGAGRLPGERALPDAVLLPTLHGGMIEGLDEVRNATWANGRRVPLPVIGMDGTSNVVDGLNAAYVQSDALAYLANGASLGFDAAPLVAREIGSEDIAFDTGDLVVVALDAGPDALGFEVRYGGKRIRLFTCDAAESSVRPGNPAMPTVACTPELSDTVVAVWPLTEPLFLLQTPAE